MSPPLLAARQRRLLADQGGAAAMEFAILIPVLLALYLGGFDISRKVNASSKLTQGAQTLSDLTSQETTGQDQPGSDISSFITAATAVMAPFTAGAKVTVSAVDFKVKNLVCCVATVRWSVTQGGSLRPCGVELRQIAPSASWARDTIPASIATQKIVFVSGLQTFAGSVIVTDVGYTYKSVTPGVAGFLSGTMMKHAYALPRTYGQVTLAAPLRLALGQTGVICPSS